MRTFEGALQGEGLRVAVVVARFNGFLTEPLLQGALDTLRRHGVRDEDLTVVRVAGTFELAPAARRVAQLGNLDALVALGVVIRGETTHHTHVASAAAKGLGDLALGSAGEPPVAVGFGVLTCETLEQAIARAGAKQGNKGVDAALAALEQANLYRDLQKKR